MKPGDVVTCTSCGAQAVATFSSGADRWQEGWALALTWTHGPHPRVEVTHVAPAECLWCHELHQAVPGAEPRYRPAPGATISFTLPRVEATAEQLVAVGESIQGEQRRAERIRRREQLDLFGGTP